MVQSTWLFWTNEKNRTKLMTCGRLKGRPQVKIYYVM